MAGDRCTELRDPACSVAMGSRYLAYLLDRFDGSLVAALAAYNGGEGRMSRWRKQFDPAADPMVAMELIGLRETRLYVGKVLETLCFYYGSAGEREAAER
jgi:soluble lytic murein transglycosylase